MIYSCRMLHQEDSILTNLFPDDSGTESPNPVTPYLLQRADVSGFSELASELGRPYVWAQKAAGVNFPVLMNEVRNRSCLLFVAEQFP